MQDSSIITDVSFAGAQIVVDGMSITDFMDDTNPIEVSTAKITKVETTVNGAMFRSVAPAPVMVSISVVPNSDDDHKLTNLFKACYGLESNGRGDADREIPIDIRTKWNTWHFAKCTLVSGVFGVSASGGGKMNGKTYTFACSGLC